MLGSITQATTFGPNLLNETSDEYKSLSSRLTSAVSILDELLSLIYQSFVFLQIAKTVRNSDLGGSLEGITILGHSPGSIKSSFRLDFKVKTRIILGP